MKNFFKIKPWQNLLYPQFLKNFVSRQDLYVNGSVILIILGIITIIIWALLPGSMQLLTKQPLTAFIKLSGILAIQLFAFTFILATRWPILEQTFSSIERVYKVHEIIGRLVLNLGLTHLILLIIKYISTLEIIKSLLIPSGSLNLDLGILGLYLMIIVIVLTIWIRIPYNIWFQIHRLMIIPYTLLVLHGLVADGVMNSNFYLKAWMLFWIFLGFIAFIYKFLLYHYVGHSMEVRGIRILGNVTEILLQADKKFRYEPGQFIYVAFTRTQNNLPKEKHPFTISNYTQNGLIRITIKNLGDYTAKISQVKIGDRAMVYGPYGDFSMRYLYKKKRDNIWVAGGVGIAPFTSMAEHLEKNPHLAEGRKILLFYCVNLEGEDIYREELETVAAKVPNFQLITIYTTTRGQFFSVKELIEKFGDADTAKKANIFLCGPGPMMDALVEQFKEEGFKGNRIESEEFELV